MPRTPWISPDEDLQKKLAADPLRPQFHLLPAKNWMNDPNGPIYWKGHYHMFFQYNPGAAVWGDMHWAHGVSEDMIHWRHLPIALAPTPGWDDADGCFTGSAVDDHGTATILYTGVKRAPLERSTLRDGHNNFREVQCLATSTDPQLRAWKKFNKPVIEPPNDPQLTGFRDPFLWRQGNDWLLGVASGHAKQGGCVLLYRSKDLRSWEYLHQLTSGKWTEKELTNPVDSGEMWECPDFFPLGKKHVLLYSTAGQVVWESGELDIKALKFHPEKRGILDHGAYYAQKTQLDAHGTRILWGWIPEKRPDAELIAAGWAGCMALPRTLSLSPDGELEMTVAPEAQSLREKSRHPKDSAKSSEELQDVAVEDLRGELAWKAPANDFRFALEDRSGAWWSMVLTQKDSATSISINGAAVEIPSLPNKAHEFHLFLDGSVAELIVNRRHAITTRIYRQPHGPLRIKSAKDLHLSSFEAWQLRPISANRLTT
ncbi:MAG: glycoside hydrolase family 32 protein [Acidobacteriota bacterium]|nr:glycoside hydrolase family 32 protein [Acidobacteriota bacterium]